MLTHNCSPWELEYFKASLGDPETITGIAEIFSKSCHGAADSRLHLCLPGRFQNLRTIIHTFARKGMPVRATTIKALLDRFRFIFASLIAMLTLSLYLVRYTRHNTKMPSEAGLLVAVHGEWSNRTRHLLEQIDAAFSPDAILVIGYPRISLPGLRKLWTRALDKELPELCVPASINAAIRALPDMLGLLRKGFYLNVSQPYLPPIRDHAAIVFRVLLGSVMEQWWKKNGIQNATVFFGHTGTADTTMLERAQQADKNVTVHAVHGLADGPNFIGFSNQAIFKCGYDAQLYDRLGQYGTCLSQPVPKPEVSRASHGLCILTNFAHPMNPGYCAHGIEDELKVLRDVSEVARTLGEKMQPMYWKPHPITASLPDQLQNVLHDEAGRLGYGLVSQTSPLVEIARQVRCVLCTPSTVAIDLLAAGYLCIVLDWQGGSADTAPMQFPTCVKNTDGLVELLKRLDSDAEYRNAYNAAWEKLTPSADLNLASIDDTGP